MKLISRRVVLAATKLALIYCVLLSTEVGLLILVVRERLTLRDLASAVSGLLIPFGIAFLLLAVARRAGFVVLWTILVAFWGALLIQAGHVLPVTIAPEFVLWSMLAMPLWIIGHVGVQDRAVGGIRIGRARISWATATLICWLLLFAGAVALFPPIRADTVIYPRPLAGVRVWALPALVPVWIAVVAIRHVWRGTAVPIAGD